MYEEFSFLSRREILWFKLTGFFVCLFFRVVLSSVLESRSSLSSSDKTNAWMQSGMDIEPQYTHILFYLKSLPLTATFS